MSVPVRMLQILILILVGWLSRPVLGVGYEVVAVYPHDQQAFTQGLVFYQGDLYESTGLKGQSSLRKVDLQTGEVLKRYNLSSAYFAEGLAVVGDRLVQLTWKSRRGFVYKLDDFEVLSTFSYETEGWGLTYDGKHLIMSDGSAVLRFLDTDTFESIANLTVRSGLQFIDRLNELEYIEGLIYANMIRSTSITIIDPRSGEVVDFLDLRQLVEAETTLSKSAGVLNGIAYDKNEKRLFVTGKNWRRLYALRLTP